MGTASEPTAEGHRALPRIPGPVELSTQTNCKGLSCSVPTQPALKAARPAAPRCPSLAPSPGVPSSLNWGSSTGSGLGRWAWRWLPWTTPWGGDWVGLGLGPAGHRGWLSTGQGRLSGAVPWGQQSTKESRPQGSQGPEECWARQSRAHLPGAPMPNACTTVAWP